MDDIIEVIIYLAFILLSAGGGIYKSYAKKKAEEAKRKQRDQQAPSRYDYEDRPIFETQENPRRPSTLEEFLQQQFEIEEKSSPVFEEEESLPVQSDEPSKLQNEGEAVFESTTDELLSDNMDEPDFSITDSLTDQDFYKENDLTSNSLMEEEELDFDLRQAVINSEILNRKY